MAQLPEPGSTFADKYVIESELGRGAAGVVLSAMHTGLKQRVAIKVLRDAGGVAAERMAREARAAVTLQSEHVVRVMDVGRDGGHVFLVMEKLEGSDLGALLKERGSLPVPEAVDYVLQACAGVAEAHARGIVHRDLKPSNLFLARRSDGGPLVKVLDFGISKSDAPGDSDASLTGPAEVLGSPMYMAPEQVRGAHNADHRSDVWSLGVILFRLVTGKAPFGSGKSVSAALASVIADEPVRLRELLPGAPRELEDIMLGCMAKSPDDRIASVAELATRLAPFGTDDGRAAVVRLMRERAPAAEGRSRRMWPLFVAGVAILAVVAGLVAELRHREKASSVAQAAVLAAPSAAVAPAPSATGDVPVVPSAVVSATPVIRTFSVRPVPRPRPPPNSSVVRSAATDDRY